jgi:hypothetical protein
MRIYEALRTSFSVYNSDNARLLNLFRFGIKLDKGRYGKYTLAALEPMEPYVRGSPQFSTIVDLIYGDSGSINGALFDFTTGQRAPTGTGVIQPFLRVSCDRGR